MAFYPYKGSWWSVSVALPLIMLLLALLIALVLELLGVRL